RQPRCEPSRGRATRSWFEVLITNLLGKSRSKDTDGHRERRAAFRRDRGASGFLRPPIRDGATAPVWSPVERPAVGRSEYTPSRGAYRSRTRWSQGAAASN